MELIVLSIIFGVIGLFIGVKINWFESLPYFLGIIGFFSPGLYTLNQLYIEIRYRQKKDK